MAFLRENAQIILIIYTWIFVVVRNAVFPREVRNWYGGIYDTSKTVRFPFSASIFMKTMKVFANKRAFKERSDLRNIVFDLFRCNFCDVVFHLAFDGPEAFVRDDYALVGTLVSHSVYVAVLSFMVNRIVQVPVWYRRFRLGWSILMIEFVTVFGYCLLNLLNLLESHHEGNAIWVGLLLWMELHYGLAGDWFEDYTNGGDMNQSYGQKGLLAILPDNLPTYLPYIVGTPVLTAIQMYFHGTILRYDSFQDAISNYTKHPLKWQTVDLTLLGQNLYDNSELGASQLYAQVMFLAVTVIFSQVILYYQRQFLEECAESDAAGLEDSTRRVHRAEVEAELDVSGQGLKTS